MCWWEERSDGEERGISTSLTPLPRLRLLMLVPVRSTGRLASSSYHSRPASCRRRRAGRPLSLLISCRFPRQHGNMRRIRPRRSIQHHCTYEHVLNDRNRRRFSQIPPLPAGAEFHPPVDFSRLFLPEAPFLHPCRLQQVEEGRRRPVQK